MRRHALPFWRCWNRPMDTSFRFCFWVEFVLVAYNALLGVSWTIYSAFLFSATTVLWTLETVKQYRKGLDRDDPPSGDRFEVHDRHDIFRRFPWQ